MFGGKKDKACFKHDCDKDESETELGECLTASVGLLTASVGLLTVSVGLLTVSVGLLTVAVGLSIVSDWLRRTTNSFGVTVSDPDRLGKFETGDAGAPS